MTEDVKKDELDDILKDLDGDEGDKDGEEDLDALKSQIAELKKQNAGLLNETKAQRRKRQDTESRLDRLTNTVGDILKQRTAAQELVSGPAQTKAVDNILKFDYDEDGNPVAKADQIKSIVSADVENLQQKVAQLEALLQASVQSQQAETEADKVIQAIVGSDERFGPAYQRYQNARKWVEDRVVEYQKDNNFAGVMSSGQALDYVFDDRLEAEFASKFPGIPLERVVTAEDSQRHFKNTLSSIANAMSPERNDDSNDRFKKVLKKPGNFGRSPNSKGGLSIEEKLQSLRPADILDMSDENVKSLERLLAKAEE